MEIIRIFGDGLFSFHLDGEKTKWVSRSVIEMEWHILFILFGYRKFSRYPEGMSVTDCVNMLQNNAADLDLFFTLQRTAQEEIGINFLNHLEIQNTD